MISSFSGRMAFLAYDYGAPVQFKGRWYGSVMEAFRAGDIQPDKVGLVQMWFITVSKYKPLPIRDLLLATGEEELVETNFLQSPFWSVDKKGANEHGKLLMRVRDYYVAGPRFTLDDLFKDVPF